jgi:hypothetical protein
MATTANLTTLANVLKEYYAPAVVEQLNNEVYLFQKLDTDTNSLYGKRINVPLHNQRSGGIGARAEDADLPSAGAQGYVNLTYTLKYLYGRLRVTGPSMELTSSDLGAFVRSLGSEMTSLKDDLARDLARQVYGDGTGAIATGVASGSSTTVTVLTSREALDKGHIYPGMVVDIGTLANPVSKCTGVASTGVGVVTVVTPATPSFTTAAAGAGTVANGEFVFRAGNALASSISNEINGLQGMVASAATALGGITPTTDDYWDNLRINVNGELVLDSLQQAVNRVRVSGGKTDTAITTFGIQRKIFNQLQSQVRYMEPTKIAGGFESISYNGLPVVADRDCNWGRFYMLDTRFIKVYSNKDWHFLEEEGNVLKWVTGRDAWEAALARYMQIGMTRRNTSLVLYGITDATGY